MKTLSAFAKLAKLLESLGKGGGLLGNEEKYLMGESDWGWGG